MDFSLKVFCNKWLSRETDTETGKRLKKLSKELKQKRKHKENLAKNKLELAGIYTV